MLFLSLSFCVGAFDSDVVYSEDLFHMDIEDLLQVDITSVSKSPRKLKDSPAAIHVLTCEDIRRSGATSIPELFRLVPGMNVARSESGRWQVSVRGFNQSFSTKLLVLIDGRTVYNHLMAGVYWDIQDVILEDIDRIEIIRGPGAALWGANAVNGVINIITKSAKDTQGGQLIVTAGDEDKLITSARYGGTAGNAAYRIFVQHYDRDPSWIGEGEPIDDSDLVHGGFRIDWDLSKRDSLTLQGGIYEGESDSHITTYSLLPPYSSVGINENYVEGLNLLGRYQHMTRAGDKVTYQVYYDRTERKSLKQVDEERDTFDVDIQQAIRPIGHHSLMWGVEYRYTDDDTVSNDTLLFNPASRQDDLYSAFVQDDISLCDDKFHFIVGTKYEHSDYYSGWQPSGRMIWNASEHYSLWAGVSRALRAPSRFDRHAELDLAVIPPMTAGAIPTLMKFYGNDDVDAESTTAYEIGLRLQPMNNILLDLTAFFNDYSSLYVADRGMPVVKNAPVTHTELPLTRSASNDGDVSGVEVSVDWWALSNWRLTANYSLLEMNSDRERNNEETPASQAVLRSLYNLPHGMEFDVTGYYVAGVPWHDIESYYRMDARLGWHCTENLIVSLVGQNILDDHHPEFLPDGSPYQTEIERSVYGKVTWLF